MIETLESRSLFAAAAAAAAAAPAFAHIVLVVEENHGYSQIVGNAAAPYINSLASGGALLTDMHAVTQSSEPNYLALFSGSTQGVTDDAAHTFDAPNLGAQLRAAGRTFVGYGEAPTVRRHDPWESFVTSATMGKDFSQFPSDYSQLPDVSMVVPNLDDQMHDGSIQQGDAWLKSHLDGYARWAASHNSLLIVTWDEDDGQSDNHIATILYGARVAPGARAGTSYDHYNVLRTIEAGVGLPGIAHAAAAAPIAGIWTAAPPTFIADANGDHVVDIVDFTILASNYGRTTAVTQATGDFNADGRVDVADFDLLASTFGERV